ncbi:Ribosomal RNA small subunit methyltransferase A [Hordeum vulgare]|nr:Ribosomal RNA small subunit methyltransferase A [Hordeum vulgare]
METVSMNEDTGKGAMWELEKSLDQPMDAEAETEEHVQRKEPEYKFKVERDNFFPEPTVDGGVIRFKIKDVGEYLPVSSNKSFFSMVNSVFNGKRKMLRKSLQHLYSSVQIEAALTNIGLPPTLYDISGKSPEVHLNTKMSIDAILSCIY